MKNGKKKNIEKCRKGKEKEVTSEKKNGTWGGFHKAIYALRLKFALCAHLFPYFSIMYLRLTPNLLHFLPDLDALYALCHTPNFYEIHPGYSFIAGY
jgi:hypothetical protein